MKRLISGVPAKAIRKTARGNRGHVDVHGRPIDYQSTLERDLLILLNNDPTVEEAVGQPVTLKYRHRATDRPHDYPPDVYVRHGGRPPREVLYQVKHRADLWEAFKQHHDGWLEARRVAAEHGMVHRVITDREIRGPFTGNAWVMKRFGARERDGAVERRLADALRTLGPTTPEALMSTAYPDTADRADALPQLWRMVAHGLVAVDLRKRLTMSSGIAPAREDGQWWIDPYSSR